MSRGLFSNISSFFSDYFFKLLIVGEIGAGKSSLLLRYTVCSSFIFSYFKQRVYISFMTDEFEKDNTFTEVSAGTVRVDFVRTFGNSTNGI
jgi:GTPase SAR1 family protein